MNIPSVICEILQTHETLRLYSIWQIGQLQNLHSEQFFTSID